MRIEPLQIAVTLANLLLGLAVAASAAFLDGRSRSAALFFAIAGIAFMLGELGQALMFPMWRHVGSRVMEPIMFVVNCGKNLGFFGGMLLGVRALALAAPPAQPAQPAPYAPPAHWGPPQ